MRFFTAAAFWGVLLFVQFAFGQDLSLSVNFISPSLQTAHPGDTVTLGVNVLNLACERRQLRFNLQSPFEWAAIPNRDSLLQLEAGQTLSQTLLVIIPEDAAPGQLELVYAVFDSFHPDLSAFDHVGLVVEPIPLCSEHAADVVISPALIEEDDDAAQRVKPGTVTILSEVLNNTSDKTKTFKLQLDLPAEWELLNPLEPSYDVAPDQSHLLLLPIKVPMQTLAGAYVIGLEQTADGILLPESAKKVFIEVERVYKLDAEFGYAPTIMPAGDLFEAELHLKNSGNVPLNLSLDAKADPYIECIDYPEGIELAPGAAATARFIMETGDFPCSAPFYLMVKVLDENLCEPLFQKTLVSELIPTGNYEEDPYIRIPGHMRIFTVGETDRTAVGVEFAGGGIIDPERELAIEFLFKLPSYLEGVIYNEYQTFYLGLFEPNWSLILGDDVYELSPLTERWRYGRGGAFSMRNRLVSMGVFYDQNIFDAECNLKEGGGYIAWELSDSLEFDCNYYKKVEEKKSTADIVSLESFFVPSYYSYSHFEWGHDFGKDRRHKDNNGLFFASRQMIGHDIWVDTENIYAGPSFKGYYQNTHAITGSVDFPVYSTLRGNLSGNWLKQNLIHCFKRSHCQVAPHQQQYNAQFSYLFTNGVSATATALHLRARDASRHHEFDFDQDWGGLNLAFNYLDFNCILNSSWGTQKDYRHHKRVSNLQSYFFYANRQWTQNFQTGFVYQCGNTNYYDARPWRSTIGFSARYQYHPKLWCEGSIQKTRNYPNNDRQFALTGSAGYLFDNGHLLTVMGQYLHTYPDKFYPDYYFLVSYTIPFDMPVKKRCDIGSFEGTLYSQHDGSPISNAVVNLGGERRMTDSTGNFRFTGIPVGRYALNAEILPTQMITYDSEALFIDIQGAKNRTMDIPIIQSAAIKGSLCRLCYNELPEWPLAIDLLEVEKQLLPCEGVEVRIYQEETLEVFRTVTSSSGRFSFAGLRPGTWRIHVNDDEMPQNHYINMNDIVLVIEPGESREIEFKFVPNVRGIKPIELGLGINSSP